MPINLPDVRQKITLVDKYKNTLAGIRADVRKTGGGFKALRAEIKKAGSKKNLAQLKKNLATIKTSVAGISSGVRQSATRMTYAAGIATAMIGGLVTKTAIYGDNVAKTSKKLNMTVSGFQEYTHAADLAGISQDKMVVALLKMQKRLGEATAGIGYAKDIYKDLGIQIKDSNGIIRPTETLLDEVADAMVRMEDPTKRTRYLVELFGRSGADMLLLMKNGSEGLKRMREEARLYGGIMDKEAAAKSEVFIDTIARTKQVVGGVVREFGISLIPVIIDYAKKLQLAILSNRQDIKKFLSDLAVSIPRTIGTIVKAFIRFRKLTKPILDWFKKIINSIGAEKAALIAISTFIGGPFVFSLWRIVPAVLAIKGSFITLLPHIKVAWAILTANPLGLVIAGVAAAIALIIIFRKELQPVWVSIKEAINPAFREMSFLVSEAKKLISELGYAMGLTGFSGVVQQLGSIFVGWLSIAAKVSIWIATLPLRGMIATVRVGIAVWRGFLFVFTEVYTFGKKKFGPALDWLGKKWDALGVRVDSVTGKVKKFLQPLKTGFGVVKKFLNIAPESQVAQHREFGIGSRGEHFRHGMSGRSLTDAISEIGSPVYGKSRSKLAEKMKSGDMGGMSVNELLAATGGGAPQRKDKLEVDFKNMPRGVTASVSGDSEVEMNTGMAFEY